MGQAKLPYLNKVLMVGNVIKDPELRYTTAGIPVANFRIAANRRYRDENGVVKDDVCYIGVVVWQGLAERAVEYLRKGHTILVEGELKSRTRSDSDGTRRSFVEIRAQQIQVLNHRDEIITLGEKDDSGETSLNQEPDTAQHDSDPLAPVGTGTESNPNPYDYEENSL